MLPIFTTPSPAPSRRKRIRSLAPLALAGAMLLLTGCNSAQTGALLARLGLLNPGTAPPAHQFYVTDVPQRFRAVGERFLGQPLAAVEVVKW